MKYLAVLLLFSVLSACAGQEGQRRINIVHKPSGEKVDVVYWDSGDYDSRALKKINHLFRDRVTNEVYEIDPRLIDLIDEVLSALALPPGTQVQLTSGFRSFKRNAEMAQKNENVARQSYHTKGQAADIKIPDVKGKAVAAIAQTVQGGGVAYYPQSQHIHVDVGAVRTWKVQEFTAKKTAVKTPKKPAKTDKKPK